MYPVSDYFLQAVQENTRKFSWTGKITAKSGAVYEFTEQDIVKGSAYITSQCCGSTEIEIGTVYAAELGITLFSDINRYTLEEGLIELTYHLELADGAEEAVPMGIFEISEANRTIRCLEIKAYDYMLRFEKDFNGFETVGNAYAFLALCCKACNVKMAHTQAEIEAMPNGAELLSVYTDHDIGTYRDVLYYVGQVLGGFFVMNRMGELELRKYGNQAVMTIQDKHRFSSSFSDFITRYTAISSTNIKTQTAEYYALETDDGLTMNLGVNPLLQFGLEETRKTLLINILNDLSVIKYVPFDSDTIGNPALDLGDVLVFSGGHADENQLTCVTGYNIKVNGRHSLKCVGKNPRLAQAKSKNDKNLSGLINQIEAGKIGIHTFTNASKYTIGAVDAKIISIEFAAAEETHVQFFAVVALDVAADAVEQNGTAVGIITVPVPALAGDGTEITTDIQVPVELPVTLAVDGKAEVSVRYEFNDEEILLHYPAETWGSGKHVLSLYYPIEHLIPNYTNTFNVYLRMSGGKADVETGGCIASISGQGMAAAAAWDGKISLEESVSQFGIGTGWAVRGFTETIGIETMELVQRQIADSMGRVAVGAFGCPLDNG